MNRIIDVLRNPWRCMIMVDAVLMIGLFVYKVLYNDPRNEYLHLVVDYHFGFAKRAFIGTLISFVLPVVPKWLVYVLGGAVWVLALLLFLRLFRKFFGHTAATAPLFAFVFGSPFFLKNFLQTVGYFDIYGCVFAMIMLLVPARTFFYVVIGAVGSATLLLIHPIHMLLYVPTIAVIVVMRHYLLCRATVPRIVGGIALTLILAGLFIKATFFGQDPAPMADLADYLRRRGVDETLLSPLYLDMWYRPISNELERTWHPHTLVQTLPRFPVYFVLIALHWPVIRYVGRLIQGVAALWHRRLIILGIAGVTLGYVIVGVVVFDYARWFSNWAVCMFLIMHAVKVMPMRHDAPLIGDDKWTRLLGWLVTAVPRVGTSRPF